MYPFHATIEMMFDSYGSLLRKVKEDVEPTASSELLNEIDLAIKVHRELKTEFEPAIREVYRISAKQRHFFYDTGREIVIKNWHLTQESSIGRPEDSENYPKLMVVMNEIAVKLALANYPEALEKINNAIRFHEILPACWKGLISEVTETRQRFNKMTEGMPLDVIESKYFKYKSLCDEGRSAEEIARIAEKDGIDQFEIFPLIRTLFDLSVKETAEKIRLFEK